MQVFTGSSGCSLVQKFPEFTRGERNAPAVEDAFIFNKSSDYASQMECGHGRIETRECRILPADAVEDEENPNQMERAEDHCRNNIHSGLRKPHGCNEKVLHKRRGLSQSCVLQLQYVGTTTLDYWEQPALDAGCYVQRGCIKKQC